MRDHEEIKAEIEILQRELAEASKNGQNTKMLAPLDRFRSNCYSQYGEDGVVEEILRRLGDVIELDRWCVEFGAWDGVYLSNTCQLIRDFGYSAVLIEGDASRVEQLRKNFPQHNVHKICRFVGIEGGHALDSVLAETDIPEEFDFLSIDIDGMDYYVFESLKVYKPKVICIEFNPSIPNAVDFVQPCDFSIKQGSSARAIRRLAEEKGYMAVAATASNLILVDSRYSEHVCSEERTIEELNELGNNPQYIFAGYDGTILSNREHLVLNWHGVPVPIAKVQFLPSFFRIFYGDYGPVRWFAFNLYILFRLPSLVVQHRERIKQRLHREIRQRFNGIYRLLGR